MRLAPLLSRPRLSLISLLGAPVLSLLGISACILSGLLIIPFTAAMPSPGLDASWCYALNEAVARHLSFGQDIVFTFGPLASVDTRFYHPATDSIMLWGSVAIATGFCTSAFLLASRRHKWLLLLLPFFVAFSFLRDPIFIAMPALLLLSVLAVYGPSDRRPTVIHELATLLVFASTTLLIIVKGSFAGAAGLEIAFSLAVLVAYGRWQIAIRAVAACLFSLVLGWCASGQRLEALPSFFISQSPVISGYTEAMSFAGPSIAVLYFWGPAAGLIWLFHFKRLHRDGRWWDAIPTIGMLLALFIAFKSGFVRQDLHANISADVFLLIGLGIAAVVRFRISLLVLAISALACVSIETTTKYLHINTVYGRIAMPVRATIDGLEQRISQPGLLPMQFAAAKAAIVQATPWPVVQGTSDIYPTDVAILLAHDMNWDPRPTFQSYSAYTLALDQRNAEHILGPDAPDNLFVTIGPIDNRIATLEDAHSWPLFLSRYAIRENRAGWLWLTLNRDMSGSVVFGDQGHATASFGTRVSVPYGGPVWASIDIQPSLLGRIAALLFRLPAISVDLLLSDGSIINRRLIPEMARGGFLLSPYIASTTDFVDIATGNFGRRSVRSITILAPTTLFWGKRINMTFQELQIPIQKLDFLSAH